MATLVGTHRRMRFATLSGGGVATFGLAVEWLWNQGAHQPWTAALFPDAVVIALPAAVAAAVLGAALADAIAIPAAALRPARPRMPAAAVGIALIAVLAGKGRPGPRPARTGRPPRAERDARLAARRAALLDAATAVIDTDGVTATMTRMAAGAGVTKAVLYRHFGDRTGILDSRIEDADTTPGRALNLGHGITGLVQIAGDAWLDMPEITRDHAVDYLTDVLWDGLSPP